MRLPPPPLVAFILGALPPAFAQFSYPPPLTQPLVAYTSGEISSALNFSAGDNLIGHWTTPRGLASFLLYRCTHTPTVTPIYPSNSTFNSAEGHVAEDGTWEQMPSYQNGDFSNGFNSGSNPFFSDDFFEPNSTTGDLCWFELYPGHDKQVSDPNTGSLRREVTVNGASDWYFATVPFVVKPRRPTGQVVTWREDGTERGKPTSKLPGTGSRNSTETTTTKADGTIPNHAEPRVYSHATFVLLWSFFLALAATS